MATWKKVLLAGADLTSGDFTGNQRDLVAGDAIKINNGGNVNNVLLGSDSDVTIKFDIASVTALEDSESVQGTDTLLIADGSQSNAVRKISVSDVATAIGSGVTSVKFSSDAQDASDVTITTGADTGAVSIDLAGGTGITTDIASEDADTVTFNLDIATASIIGGVAPASADFDIDASTGALTIKSSGVTNDQLAGSINQNKLLGSIPNNKLVKITDTDKVEESAVRISGATSTISTANLNDNILVSDSQNSNTNSKMTLSVLNTLIASNAASLATVHADTASSVPDDVSGSGIEFLQSISFDDYGHATGATAASIPVAASGTTGLVSATTQTFTGPKTFEDHVTLGANGSPADLTVWGDLTVKGSNTIINTTQMTVQDHTVVLGTNPDLAVSEGGANTAISEADGSGLLVQSHHDSEEATGFENKYAGVLWRNTANQSGWHVRGRATAHSPANPDDYLASNDVVGAEYEVVTMEYNASTTPSGDRGGLGAFYFKEDTGTLFIRTDVA